MDDAGATTKFCKKGLHDLSLPNAVTYGQCRACKRKTDSRYAKTEKGKARDARYLATPKGRVATLAKHRRYNATSKAKVVSMRYERGVSRLLSRSRWCVGVRAERVRQLEQAK